MTRDHRPRHQMQSGLHDLASRGRVGSIGTRVISAP
jgi:hypothetical protein